MAAGRSGGGNSYGYEVVRRLDSEGQPVRGERKINAILTAAYYATALRELTHWTRHESRLDRDFGRKCFGDEGYAREELVAELGAAFLCADLGIEGEAREDHAAYLASWLKVLKEDKRVIFQVAAHAQRAADFLYGHQERPA